MNLLTMIPLEFGYSSIRNLGGFVSTHGSQFEPLLAPWIDGPRAIREDVSSVVAVIVSG